MALLTPSEYLVSVAADKAAQEKAALDYEQLIAQYNTLVSNIITELSQAEGKLDTLRQFDGIIESTGISHRINAMLGYSYSSNIPTIKAMVERARQSFQSKG